MQYESICFDEITDQINVTTIKLISIIEHPCVQFYKFNTLEPFYRFNTENYSEQIRST